MSLCTSKENSGKKKCTSNFLLCLIPCNITKAKINMYQCVILINRGYRRHTCFTVLKVGQMSEVYTLGPFNSTVWRALS